MIKARDRTKYLRQLNEALADFVRIACLLGYTRDEWSVDMQNMALLRLLFDHNGLVTRLRGGEGLEEGGYRIFAQHPQLELTQREHKRLIQRYISSLAVVELWLLGYGVRPGNINGEGPFGREVSQSLHQALLAFVRDRDLPITNTRNINLGMWFFTEAQNIQTAPEPDATVNDTDLDTVVRNKDHMRRLQKAYRSLGARIIDGVRRAFAWLKGWVKRIGRAFVQLIKNIARAMSLAASRVFNVLRDMVEVTRRGWRYFFSAQINSRDRRVTLYKDRDFDMTFMIDPQTDQLEAFLASLQLHVDALSLGGQVIGQLWRLIRQVIRTTSAALNWLGIVVVLVKLGNWVKKTIGIARRSTELVVAFEELDAGLAFGVRNDG